MIEQDHLQTCELRLTTRGPLFIGSGVKTPKKEFIFNKSEQTVSFLNENRFFDLLLQKRIDDSFEDYCLRSGRDDLYQFLHQDHRLNAQDIDPVIEYTIPVGDGLDSGHSLLDVARFIRDPQGHAYVPGSSIKGAIRTALLFQAIKNDPTPLGSRTTDNWSEESYFNTLHLDSKDPTNHLNSIMRGIHVADSEVIKNRDFCIVKKSDASTTGAVNNINLARECVAPGTVIRTRITLDQSILKGTVTPQTIMDAIVALAEYSQHTYRRHFASPPNHCGAPLKNVLYLGGGAGFFSKTLVYPYLGEAKALQYTSNGLKNIRAFANHKHDRDPALGISPHTMKYGRFHGRYYDFGACEVAIK